MGCNKCSDCLYQREHNDILKEVRERHNQRCAKDPTLKGLSYFSGWSQISTLTSRCFANSGRSMQALKGTTDEKKAVEFAQKVSDLFFEYTTRDCFKRGEVDDHWEGR